MSIVLPEPHADTARRRAAALGMTPEEYLADVVEEEAFRAYWATLTPEEKAAHEEFERTLDQAVASGAPTVVDDEWLEARLRALRERRTLRGSGHRPS